MRSCSSQTKQAAKLGFLVFVAASSFAPVAGASKTFPAELANAVPMPCVPQCTVCHLTNDGGFGTLRPNGFGVRLRDGFELFPGQPGTVRPAVDAARASLDGDGDQKLDVLELSEGGDPNSADPNAKVCGNEEPEYGCGGGRIAPGQSVDGLATLLAGFTLLGGVMLLRRKTHRA